MARRILVLVTATVVSSRSEGTLSDDVEELGETMLLRCTGCKLIAKTMYEGIDSKLAKGFKTMTGEERLQETAKRLVRACRKLDDMQIAQMGRGSDTMYADFAEAMQKGGTLSGVRMMPEFSKQFRRLCVRIINEEGSALIERMSASLKGKKKRRLLDFKMTDHVCIDMLGACEAHGKATGDDHDDDDREL